MARIITGKTVRLVLTHLAVHGPCGITHGSRYAHFNGASWQVMSSTEHLLRTSGMVEAAGGNYPDHFVRLTPYGRKCHERGWRDSEIGVPFFWGPKPDQVSGIPCGKRPPAA